jgi:hypothetical protein
MCNQAVTACFGAADAARSSSDLVARRASARDPAGCGSRLLALFGRLAST